MRVKQALCFLLAAGCLLGISAGCAGQPIMPSQFSSPANGARTVVLDVMLNSPELTEQYRALADSYLAVSGIVSLRLDIRQNDYPQVLKTKLNAGDAPDIFLTGAYKDNDIYESYVYHLTNEPFIKELDPQLLNNVTVNGNITGCPFLVQSHSFIYNKRLFRLAGITEPPETLKEYREACEALAHKGFTPFSTGFADWWVLPQIFYPSASDVNGGDYEGLYQSLKDGLATPEQLPEFAFALDVIDLVRQYGGESPMTSDFDAQCKEFADETAAIIHQGIWAEKTILKHNPRIELGYLLSPRLDGKGVIAVDSNLVFRVSKSSAELEEALGFLTWLYTSKVGREWFSGQVRQLSPFREGEAADTPLGSETQKAMREGAAAPWWIFDAPAEIEHSLGQLLQSYAAGLTARPEVFARMEQLFSARDNPANFGVSPPDIIKEDPQG